MIRPLTIVTFLMACGSGLYLYQSKHEVQVLDRTIEKSVHDTNALREQSRLLAAEWTMLNDPERLRQFSDTYLNLKSINPAQFTSLADLNSRLPAPQSPDPAPSEDGVPVAAGPLPQPVPEPAGAVVVPAIAQAAIPVPPVRAPKPPAVASVARPVEAKVAVARPAGTENQARAAMAAETHPAVPRVAEARSEVRTAAVQTPRPIVLAAPRPLPPSAPVYQQAVREQQPVPMREQQPASQRPVMAQAAVPYNGSLLGMARGSMPAAPRPTPVNATYNSN